MHTVIFVGMPYMTTTKVTAHMHHIREKEALVKQGTYYEAPGTSANHN